jgi:hypothetical protein
MSPKISSDDLILVLSPSELDTVRTALRNEQERYERHGFNGLKVAVANLRDKISNAMIDNAYNKVGATKG